jgi:hypothetical protein
MFNFPSIPLIEIFEKLFIRRSMGANQYPNACDNVLCRKFGVHARNVSESVRVQAKKCTMSGAIQSGFWRSSLG